MNEAAERRQCVKNDRLCAAKFGRNEPCKEQCKGMRKPTGELEYKAHSIWKNQNGEARIDVVIFPNREHAYDFNSRSLGIMLDKKELKDFLKEYNFELLEYNKEFEYEIDFFRGKKLEYNQELGQRKAKMHKLKRLLKLNYLRVYKTLWNKIKMQIA